MSNPPPAMPAEHDRPSPSDAVTAVHAAVVVAVSSDSCAACGAHLAGDQGYCVECGHSRGTSRMPAFAAGVPSAVAGAPRRRWRERAALSSPNATVVALIGALLLAIGVGVLIGRSNSGQGSAGASRVTTVYLSGPGASVGAVAPPTVVPPPAAKPATPAAAKKTATKTTPPVKTPPAKAVHVGSAGSGPGYQKGKFTGNFFGGG